MVLVCAHVCFWMLCTHLSDVCFENRNNTSHRVECIHQRLIHLQHVYAQCVWWGRITREVTYVVERRKQVNSIPVPKWRHHHSSWSLWQWAGKQSEILKYLPMCTQFTSSSLPCTDLHCPIPVLQAHVQLGQIPSVCTSFLKGWAGVSNDRDVFTMIWLYQWALLARVSNSSYRFRYMKVWIIGNVLSECDH